MDRRAQWLMWWSGVLAALGVVVAAWGMASYWRSAAGRETACPLGAAVLGALVALIGAWWLGKRARGDARVYVNDLDEVFDGDRTEWTASHQFEGADRPLCGVYAEVHEVGQEEEDE